MFAAQIPDLSGLRWAKCFDMCGRHLNFKRCILVSYSVSLKVCLFTERPFFFYKRPFYCIFFTYIHRFLFKCIWLSLLSRSYRLNGDLIPVGELWTRHRFVNNPTSPSILTTVLLISHWFALDPSLHYVLPVSIGKKQLSECQIIEIHKDLNDCRRIYLHIWSKLELQLC